MVIGGGESSASFANLRSLSANLVFSSSSKSSGGRSRFHFLRSGRLLTQAISESGASASCRATLAVRRASHASAKAERAQAAGLTFPASPSTHHSPPHFGMAVVVVADCRRSNRLHTALVLVDPGTAYKRSATGCSSGVYGLFSVASPSFAG